MKIKTSTLTVAKAIRMQKELFRLGKRVTDAQLELRSAVRNFRKSGAWAITPEHHRTFSRWCLYAGAIMGISSSTLQAYGCPNYLKNYQRNIEENRDTIMFTGEAARLFRKAIKIASTSNGKPTVRYRTKWAGILIAKYYLDGHKYTMKKAA